MPYIHNWHVDAIGEHLEAMKREEIRDLVVNIPPGHAKSLLISVLFPAWLWIDTPTQRFLCSSYDLSIVVRDSVKSRMLLESDWYREEFSPAWKLSTDQNAKTFYKNTRQGFRFCHTVAGKGTGHRGEWILCDDPLKAKDGNSPLKRQDAIDWWDKTMPTRLNDPRTGKRLVVMQRLHEEDLTGHIRATSKTFEFLELPSLFDSSARSITHHFVDGTKREFWRDPRTNDGELLFPELFTPEVLAGLRVQLGEADFAAQHLQRPYPAGGLIFKSEWFANRYKTLPRLTEVFTVWDLALKDAEENDETACLTMGLGEDGFYYVLRVLHGRWETPKVAEFFVEQAKYFRQLYGERYRGDYVEDKVSGTTMMQYLRRSNPELAIIPITTGREGKEERARGVTPICESGRVRLPDGETFEGMGGAVNDLIAQLVGFPKVKLRDLVDVFVYAIKRLIGTLKISTRKSRRGSSSIGDH